MQKNNFGMHVILKIKTILIGTYNFHNLKRLLNKFINYQNILKY